ncbi:ArsR/SmtB family transcription factor [Natrialbaceae archaeon AArc-T1-2]|uniref:ArsR/SmtB family transcription factor n=1 Tax=Natrialbaceae archaeon AArc-T1-2 TaxID=3053904 RepID=UPI00255B328C|nr:metalloregulator ArsR/SmtB family transcription factor [Natrialbaceae archaeon AArc-T1-2]WIV67649.1 metalloregulator ArsR/SmtB family transcription factor [Natrialbaceae archaeon AArc-T1-2]
MSDGTDLEDSLPDRLEEATTCTLPELRDRRVDEERLTRQHRAFKALANDHRICILEALRDGELCVCELEAILDIPQSTVATHLGRLREVGLVNTRKSGKWTYYRIADTATLQLLDLAAALETTDPDE